MELREAPELLAVHVAQLPQPRAARPDTVDTNLGVGRARVDASETFEEAAAHPSSREIFSILNDASALSTVLQKGSLRDHHGRDGRRRGVPTRTLLATGPPENYGRTDQA